jgi:hypothetical protein
MTSAVKRIWLRPRAGAPWECLESGSSWAALLEKKVPGIGERVKDLLSAHRAVLDRCNPKNRFGRRLGYPPPGNDYWKNFTTTCRVDKCGRGNT